MSQDWQADTHSNDHARAAPVSRGLRRRFVRRPGAQGSRRLGQLWHICSKAVHSCDLHTVPPVCHLKKQSIRSMVSACTAMTGMSPRSMPAQPLVRSSPAPASSSAQLNAVCCGDPVTDVLVQVTSTELSILTSPPGGCKIISGAQLARLLSALEQMGKPIQMLPGGSAGNVMRCMARVATCGRFTCEPTCPVPVGRFNRLDLLA